MISKGALQNLGVIEITTNGHEILESGIRQISWFGHMKLLRNLALVLRNGHWLQRLVIDITDKDLALHTTACWHATNLCEYRDNLKGALNDLRNVRGVGYVEILGINADLSRALKARMESKPISFLSLPAEIRNKIYKDAAGK